MPTLADYSTNRRIKLLNIGESGTGKTGALASLVAAGYSLHILDYDNNLGTLFDIISHQCPERLASVRYETLRDDISFTNGVPRVKAPVHAYKDGGKTLQSWDLPSLTSTDIVVLDTLSSFSDAGFNEALAVAGRLNQRPQLADYGWLADSVRLFIELLTDAEWKFHLIVNTHVRYFSGDEDTQTQSRGLPNARGQQISTTVSRYFETVLLTRTQGAGAGAKRIITTQPQGVVEVKTASPLKVDKTYPIETGLAKLFADILGGPPK